MMKLSFGIGGALRQITIRKRIINMMSQETGWKPLVIHLDKLDKNKKEVEKKLGEDSFKIMQEIAALTTEKAIAQDIIKDFQRSGWRLIKQEW